MDQNGYTWSVTSMECFSQAEGQTDVVFKVRYNCSKSIQDGYFTAIESGNVDVEYNPDNPYTPYSQLTESQVLGWVFAVLGTDGVDKVVADVDAQIAAYLNPPVVTPPLPWGQ